MINNRLTYIGLTNYRNTNKRFGIKDGDRRTHIYCLGKTGSGKSTLLLNMVVSDIHNGRGVAIIDPHGDLADSVLDFIPASRISDVIYFNATDIQNLIAFNPLHRNADASDYLIVSGVVDALKKMWDNSWGPRLEHILRNALLTLLCYPEATLLDIQPLLTNVEFRNKVLEYVSDTSLLDFWYKEFYAMPPQLKAEAISPILNKIGLFQTHPVIRQILGQSKSSFSIKDAMDSSKIFIANLSKGILGEEGTQLLGSLLLSQFQTISLQRSKLQESDRVPFYIYVDEMHSFVTLTFANILAESRKYGLSIFLTHQYLYQLDEEIKEAILGNVGTLICFRIGATDAEALEKEFQPVFNKLDLINLPNYSIYIKLAIDGTTSVPFSAITLPLPFKKCSGKYQIMEHSAKEYGGKQVIPQPPASKFSGEQNRAQSLFS